jgi:tRNA(fMet)-specific endonuclease VapC
MRIDDFDLLIGTSAVYNNMVMVTYNTKHFERIYDIKIENWIAL